VEIKMILNEFPSLMPVYNRFKVAFDHGEGPYLFDAEGKRYLDFAAGIAVSALGHCHPHLVEVLQEQAGKLWHTSNLYEIPHQEKLAERLTEASFADSVFFTNSGVESIECSIKAARKYQSFKGCPERYRIITFEKAFHGRSLATIAAGGQKKLTEGFGPMMDGFDSVPFMDLEKTKAIICENTAAILVEPVQGEGGICPASPEFLQGLRKLADDKGVVLIFDEIQCGMGRTGKLFSFEWAGIEPDIVAAAKGMGGGFPLGACLVKGHIGEAMTSGSHGTTYGGNPLATSVGNAVLDVILEDGFLENVVHSSKLLFEKLNGLKEKYPDLIIDVRGQGLMIGIELNRKVRPILEGMIGRGFLAAASGLNIIRLLPPLNIGREEIDLAVTFLDEAFSHLLNE
jgi:acetylornithine/N-succinyldiaminopimelate aminotransferase